MIETNKFINVHIISSNFVNNNQHKQLFDPNHLNDDNNNNDNWTMIIKNFINDYGKDIALNILNVNQINVINDTAKNTMLFHVDDDNSNNNFGDININNFNANTNDIFIENNTGTFTLFESFNNTNINNYHIIDNDGNNLLKWTFSGDNTSFSKWNINKLN